MLVGQVHAAPADRGVQAPPGGQEVVQRGRFRDRSTDPDPHRAGGSAGLRPAAAAAVRDLVAAAVEAHPRPRVRQPQGRPGRQHRGQPGRVEGTEHDATAAEAVDAVEADVGLQEGADPGQSRSPQQPQTDHPEADQPDVRRAVEGVGSGAAREQGSHLIGVHRPVQEAQIRPGLPRQSPPQGPRGQRCDRLDRCSRAGRHDADPRRSAAPPARGVGAPGRIGENGCERSSATVPT